MAYQYNGNGNWSEVYDNPSENGRPTRPPANSNIGNNPPPSLSDTSNKDTTESTGQANSEFIDIEDNVLVGDLTVIPDPNYKAKATVLLQYLGKNLTGLYFVDKVTHSFTNSGYNQSLTVSRNGFGETIKSGSANIPVSNVAPSQGGLMNGTGDTSRPSEATPPKVEPPKDDKVAVNKWGTVTAKSGLNVRSGPSTSYTKVTSAMPYKTRVFCKFSKNGWYEMESGSKQGWSSGEWIKLD